MTYRLGCGAGFSGDRIDAPQAVIASIAAAGEGGAIIFETIGERTLALGQLARQRDPEQGYEPLLEQFLAPILAPAIDAGIVIVGNFGCANPPAAARKIAEIAKAQGLSMPRIAVIEGDDVLASFDPSAFEVWEGEVEAERPTGDLVSANVYIGAEAIADAIRWGAQIVVAGRVGDPALALGPLAAHFGWSFDDWNKLACGTLVGHLLECGAQVTGGYFADPGFKDVPGMADIGFPIAEVEADGSFVLTKPEGSGGLVNLQTVREQILYEVHDPSAYLTPDCVLDLTSVRLEEVGPDRVAVQGARGGPAPEKLKATIGFIGDWLGEAELSYAGENALARARLAVQTVKERLVRRGLELDHRIDIIGLASVLDGKSGKLQSTLPAPVAGDFRIRFAGADPDRAKVAAVCQEVLALYCCGPASGGGQRTQIVPRVRTLSYLLPRDMVQPGYKMLQGGAA